MTTSNLVALITNVLATGTFIILIFSITCTVIPKYRTLIPKKIFDIALLLASVGTIAAPLIYQYYLGFPVCTMCWYQRIFMWPIALMALGTHIWGDQAGRRYVLSAIKWLAPAGLFFSIWHYISQWGLTSTAAACGAVGQSVSCDGIDVIVWGFVTIPFMAGLGFISLFLLIRVYTKNSKRD